MSKYTPQEITQTVLSDAAKVRGRSTQPAAVGGLFSACDIPRCSSATPMIDPTCNAQLGSQWISGHKSGSTGGPKFRQRVSV